MTNLVHIGGLTFDADPDTDEQWVCSRLQGWYSSPPMRGRTEDRPVSDGAFGSTKNYRSARVLTFDGYLLGSSVTAAQEELMDAFASVQSDGVPLSLSVENDSGTRSVTVSLDGAADVDPHPAFTGATVKAQFIAYDPIKYGPSSTSVTGLPVPGGGLQYELAAADVLEYGSNGDLGRITVTNGGTAESWPTFTVSGALDDGFIIRELELNRTLRYDRVVPLGTTVELDPRTGAVTIDGVSDASTYLTRDEWFSVAAGGSATIQFSSIGASSGSPELSVSFANGYW